jgi:predicted DNA-binding protein with PD1-like motif
MRSRVVQAGPDTVVVAVLDPGDDAVAALGDLARERELASSQITAVGAFYRVA